MAPVWIMGVISFILLVLVFWAVIGIMRTRHHDAAVKTSLGAGFLFLIFLSETILYWVIRKRHFPRSPAWLHIGCTLAVFVLPYFVEVVVLPAIHETAKSEWIIGPMELALFIIGNIFFVITIIKAFSTNSTPVIEDELSPKTI